MLQKLNLENQINMIISNPADRKTIKDAIVEFSNSATRAEAEKDLQKNIIEDLADKVGVEKKYLSKLAAFYHKQNFATVQQEKEEIEELYESVMTTQNPTT
jgi:hypothetical protein